MPGELQKALKEAIKAKKCGLGARTAAATLKKCKLLVVSASAPASLPESAEGAGVPVVRLASTSVELGRLCGRQHRVSAVSFTGITVVKVKQTTQVPPRARTVRAKHIYRHAFQK